MKCFQKFYYIYKLKSTNSCNKALLQTSPDWFRGGGGWRGTSCGEILDVGVDDLVAEEHVTTGARFQLRLLQLEVAAIGGEQLLDFLHHCRVRFKHRVCSVA